MRSLPAFFNKQWRLLVQRNVWPFGILAGLILTAMMVYSTLTCYYRPQEFRPNYLVGFLLMFLAFGLMVPAMLNVRRGNGGIISYPKAFLVGFYVSLIASTMYVLVWLIEYYFFIPDFLDAYIQFELKDAAGSGLSGTELDAKRQEMEEFKSNYENPLFVIMISYAEVLPVGLVLALITALFVRKNSMSGSPSQF